MSNINGEDSDNCPRISRKKGEKVRRDKLNTLFAQLAEENPWSAKSEKRVDKAAILRLTVSYLKFHHGIKKLRVSDKKSSSHLTSNSILACLQEALKGFLIVISEKETIVFVSSSITKILGLHQVDMVGSDLSKFVHPDDMELFRKQLNDSNEDLGHTMNDSLIKPNGNCYTGFNSSFNSEKSFYVRMLKAFDRNDTEKQYEMVHLKGQLKINKTGRNGCSESGVIDSRWLIAVGQSSRLGIINEVPTLYAKDDEFVTQFDLLGNIWFIDHRSAIVMCRLPNQQVGTSCYDDVLKEDVPVVAHAHKQIMKSPMTTTVFRVRINGDRVQYLMSRSIIVRDNWTNKPKYIVSLNIALSKEEGNKLLEKQRKELEEYSFTAGENKGVGIQSCKDSKVSQLSIDVRADESETSEADKSKVRMCDKLDILLENIVNKNSYSFGCETLSRKFDSVEDKVLSSPYVCSNVGVNSLKRSLPLDFNNENSNILHDIEVKSISPSSSQKEKLLLNNEVSADVNLTSFLNDMDMSKSPPFNGHSFQNCDSKFVPKRKFQLNHVNGDVEMLARTTYGSPHKSNGCSTKTSFGNSFGNNHLPNLNTFHPYHRDMLATKAFQGTNDCVRSFQNDIQLQQFHSQMMPLSFPHTLSCGSTHQSAGLTSSNRVYSSNMYPIPDYSSGNVSTSLTGPQSYDRVINQLLPSGNRPPFGHELNRGPQKSYGYPYFGVESMVNEPQSQGYGLFDKEISRNSSVPKTNVTNVDEESFDKFPYDPTLFGNKPIRVTDYLELEEGNSYLNFGSHPGFPQDKLKYTNLDAAQQGVDDGSSDEEARLSRKCSVTGGWSDDSDNSSCKVKVQSPTVDSVTSPSNSKKIDEKELQIQYKLSQQLHSKQNLIGNNLTNQREELNMLKVQLKEKGSVSNQCLELLQRLHNLEKEVQEQDSILTDLKEQSTVKMKQLVSHE
ncbi:circadian locomoter output cycles protein kaput-like isoform X1 [Mytilus californianus]|uniref:circadian locomoter output cycles protein kaput-like isoform X1 n=1 Tax=Mytilus californianus TaxID=6549 RepID=UPI0022470037|nr:circadian locomoter output cycles protein kaput-like isoform X1 [Mytilus californianus]